MWIRITDIFIHFYFKFINLFKVEFILKNSIRSFNGYWINWSLYINCYFIYADILIANIANILEKYFLHFVLYNQISYNLFASCLREYLFYRTIRLAKVKFFAFYVLAIDNKRKNGHSRYNCNISMNSVFLINNPISYWESQCWLFLNNCILLGCHFASCFFIYSLHPCFIPDQIC